MPGSGRPSGETRDTPLTVYSKRSDAAQPRVVLLILILAAAGLRWYGLDRRDLWIDEAFSLWMVRLEWPELLSTVATLDHHPPLYYVLLGLWTRGVGETEIALRLLSGWFGVATIPVFYQLGTRVLGRRGALVATAILAAAPFHVEYAQEARMYALLALAAVCALWFAVRVLGSVRPGVWPVSGLGIAQAAVMLSHNTAAFLFPVVLNLTAVICLTGATRNGAQWRGWLGGQLIALLVWASWAPAFGQQAQTVADRFWVPMPTAETLWLAFQSYTVGHPPAAWLGAGAWRGVDVWVVGMAGLACLGLWRVSAGAQGRMSWAVLWLGAPVLAALISLYRPVFLASTLIWTTLPLYLLVGAGVNALVEWATHPVQDHSKISARRVNWLVAVLASCAIIGMAAGMAGGLVGLYGSPPREEWRRAARYVAHNAQAGDLLLFHATWTQLPFDYYAPSTLEGLARRGVPVDLFEGGELEPPMTPADRPVLVELVHAHERVWLVYSHQWYTDPQGLVLETLHEQYTEVKHESMIGVDIWFFSR